MTDPGSSRSEAQHLTPLTIRPAAVEDADTIAILSAQLGYDVTPDELRSRLADLSSRQESQAVFVACLSPDHARDRGGDKLVGWIEVAMTYHLQSPPFGLIGGLVVGDDLRGLGIGRRLCEEAEAWTRARGVDLIRVTSRSTRHDAHRFYLRDGFKETKTSKVFEKILG